MNEGTATYNINTMWFVQANEGYFHKFQTNLEYIYIEQFKQLNTFNKLFQDGKGSARTFFSNPVTIISKVDKYST